MVLDKLPVPGRPTNLRDERTADRRTWDNITPRDKCRIQKHAESLYYLRNWKCTLKEMISQID